MLPIHRFCIIYLYEGEMKMKKRIIALLLLVELLMMLVLVYLLYSQKGGANITDE